MSSNKYVIIGVLLALAAAALGGFYLGKGEQQVVVQEKVVYKEGETKTVIKDRIVTVTRTVKPDGTVTETTKTEDKDTTKDARTTVAEKDTNKSVTPVLSKYSLGLKYWLPLTDKILSRDSYSRDGIEIVAGRRLVGEIWGQAGYKLDNSFTLGVSFQF